MTRHARQHRRPFAPVARMVRAALRPGQTRLPHRRRARLAAMVGVAVTVVGLWAAAPRPLPVVPYDPSGPFTVDTDLYSQSGLSAAGIYTCLAARSTLPPLGAAFVAAERTYGVNARYLVANALLESGRGSSHIARTFHNLFGWNAVDADPVATATRFADDASSIDFVARQVSELYLTPGGRWWGGAPTLRGMNQRYASDPGWAAKIAGLADELRAAALH